MLLAAFIAAILPVQATTYGHRLPVADLLDRSERVVRGTVAGTVAEFGEDKLIWTTVTLEVSETLARSNAALVQFRLPGGTVGDLSLTVPGAPSFELGQDVMVFLDGDRLRGFGQGAFLIEEGKAWRGLGNAMEANPVHRPVHQLIGDLPAARDCIRTRTHESYADGWALRGTHSMRMGSGEEKAMSVTLVGGMEYRVEACGDGQAGPIDLVVFDAEGRELAWETGEKGSAGLRFRPEDTGEYFVAIVNQSLAPEVLRAGVVISLSYR